MGFEEADRCRHENTVMNEYSLVCTTCGLCIDQLYSGVDMPTTSRQMGANDEVVARHTSQSEIPSSWTKMDKDFDMLLNICSNAGLPNQCANMSHDLYKIIRTKIANDKKVRKPRSFKPILLACLYSVLQREQISFTLKELTAHSFIPSNVIANAHSRWVQKQSAVSTLHIYERFCGKLHLPREIVKDVCQSLTAYENCSSHCVSPNTAAAATIFYHCRKHKWRISLKLVSQVSGCATISITRFIRKYTKAA